MTAPDQTNAEVSDERPREAWPLHGYAPGSYTCRCHTCDKQFVGDKRAVTCLECAVIKAKDALNRRSVTSQASEGQPILWVSSKQLPDPVVGGYAAARAAPESNFDTPLYASSSKRVERLETLKECASIAQDCPGIVKSEHSNVDPFWQGVAAAKVAIMKAIQALQGGRPS